MVAMVIIGVAVSFVSIAIGGADSRRLQQEGNKLRILLEGAAEEAILNAREMGVAFDSKGYSFFDLDEKDQWHTTPAGDVFGRREWPSGMRISLLLEGVSVEIDAKPRERPQVFMLSSGETSPFVIELFFDSRRKAVLEVDLGGKGELSLVDA